MSVIARFYGPEAGKKHELGDKIKDSLDQLSELRPFPASVSSLLASLNDPQANAKTYANIIECDAALAVRLLRAANSPLYGVSNEVRSIEHAVTLLGVRSLKSLALSLAGASLFHTGSKAVQERQQVWKHSLGCATVARALARYTTMVPHDEAFLAGIFHDVGKLFLYDFAPQDYATISASDDLIEHERHLFDVTHEELGIRSASRWNLAEEIKVAIGYHHRSAEGPTHREYATVVSVANQLAYLGGVGSAPNAHAIIDDAELEFLGVPRDALPTILDESNHLFGHTQQICA